MSGMQIRAFCPLGVNKTVNVAVSVVSQSLAIPDTPLGTRAIRLVVLGTQPIFIELVKQNRAAGATTTTSMAMLNNSVEVFTLPNDVTALVVIAAATGSTLYMTYGEGI